MRADGINNKEEVEEAARLAAEKLRAGTYYDEALEWYNDVYHSPITDRAPIVILIGILGVVSFLAVVSFFALFPLNPVTPIVIGSHDVDESFPRLVPLIGNNMEDPNPALQKWYVSSFTSAWESYDIDKLDSLRRRVRFLSEPKLFEQYRRYYLGEESPALRYERHTVRKVAVSAVTTTDDRHAVVTFIATEEGPQENKKSMWRADITFAYEEIKVDQITNEITPMKFRVVDYKVEKIG